MSDPSIKPFKVSIPEQELELLRKKLALTRFPNEDSDTEWGETNGVSYQFVRDTVKYWLDEYDWRSEEAKINELPQFKTDIALDDFGVFDIHFVHSKTKKPNAIPLLFLHGWPGSFMEVQKVLPIWNEAGFDVVAPSLPGYGFSSYTKKSGFKFFHHVDVFQKLMIRLGYDSYAVQGGDWGSLLGRSMALRYPQHVKVLHLNVLMMRPPKLKQTPTYTPFELAGLARAKWFGAHQKAYQAVHRDKPRTLSFALHDSPAGMLAWMADKLFLWTDHAYPWTPSEIITWTLLHYLPGPGASMNMYRENIWPNLVEPPEMRGPGANYVRCPVGFSMFAKELGAVPRVWAETMGDVRFWREHESGGHFAAWEKPEELAGDVVEFVRRFWGGSGRGSVL